MLDAAENRLFRSYIAWHSISNFHYLVDSWILLVRIQQFLYRFFSSLVIKYKRMMRLKHPIFTCFVFLCLVQLSYAQKSTEEPKVENTLRDIYEKLEKLDEDIDKRFSEVDKRFDKIEQTLARHDEQLEAINQRLDTQIQTFWTTIVLLVTLLAGIFTFNFNKLNQVGERLSSLETLLTGDIKPARQQVMEMAFQRTEEFKRMQQDAEVLKQENKELKEDIEKLKSALAKANLL